METLFMVILIIISEMDQVYQNFNVEIDMRENGKMIKFINKDNLKEKMVNIIMENGFKMQSMVKEYPYKPMEMFMMANVL